MRYCRFSVVLRFIATPPGGRMIFFAVYAQTSTARTRFMFIAMPDLPATPLFFFFFRYATAPLIDPRRRHLARAFTPPCLIFDDAAMRLMPVVYAMMLVITRARCASAD